MQEGVEVICKRLGKGVTGGVRQAVELGAFHRLLDGDAPEIPPCHRIPGHPPTDREAIGRLVGRATHNDRGGHIVLLHAVPHRRPAVRNHGA